MKNERFPKPVKFPDSDGCYRDNGEGSIGCSTETIIVTDDMRPTAERIPRV